MGQNDGPAHQRNEDIMRKIRRLFIGLACAPLLLAACVPIFTDGTFQTLKLLFELGDAIDAGEERLFQISAFPGGVKVRKTFVQISGRLEAPDGEGLPSKVKVLGVFEDEATGKVTQRISMTLNVGSSGLFSANKKVKKNIGTSDVMSVTLAPSGAGLAKGTEVTLCVDLVKKKAELRELPPCVEIDDGGDGGDGNGQATLTSLQNDFFTPTCARSGCHSTASAQAGLILSAGQSFGNLVNVPSSQNAGFNRVTPGDAETSYLIKKLRGDSDISGERMPRGGPFLSAEELDRFVDWINGGAQDN
jgi:hypothetical protein